MRHLEAARRRIRQSHADGDREIVVARRAVRRRVRLDLPALGRPSDSIDAREITVIYPARFELYSADELIDNLTKLQLCLQNAGEAPQVEGMTIRSIVRQLLLGLQDDEYETLDEEIDTLLEAKASIKEQKREMADAGITNRSVTLDGDGSAELAGGEDPTGQSGGTMVCNMIPAVV